LRVGSGANNFIQEKSTVNETSRAYGGGQDPHRVVAPVKKRKKKSHAYKTYRHTYIHTN
jgi:hypothetical protein